MVSKFSFRQEKTPSWEIELNDDAHTILHVTIPTKGLFSMLKGLMARLDNVSDSAKGRDVETIVEEIYDVGAELMSRNEESITVTGAELDEKYGVSLEYLLKFFHGYVEFVNDYTNSKN